MPEWPSDAKLEKEQAMLILESLIERFMDGDPSGEGDPLHRPKKLVNRIFWNRAHLHNLPVADPYIPEPYHEGTKFQTGRPQQIWSQLKARLIENPYVVSATTVNGKSTAASDRLEKVLQVGLMETENRTSQNFMGGLADGAICYCYGVLHWRRAEEFYPHEMKREYSDVPPKEDNPRNWEMSPMTERDKGMFRETAPAYDDRRAGERMKLGFPYTIQVLHPGTIFPLFDDSMENGAAIVAHIRRMLVIDYEDSLKRDGMVLSINETDKTLRIYREQDAAPDYTPSRRTEEATVVNMWTRDECYEFATVGHRVTNFSSANWEYVKHFTHDWGMPPFALAPGFEMLDADPVHRYQPALEGIYRIKAGYDRLVSLWMVIAEMTALPVWYLEDTTNNVPMLTEDGRMMTFTRNAAQSERLPPGTRLQKMEWNIRPEYLKAIEMYTEELQRSEPSTGLASFSASTQPWTARLEQQQQSIQPKQILQNIVKAMRTCVKHITSDIARRDEPVTLWAYDEQTGKGEVAEVTPKECANMRAYVNVDNVSAAERFSKIEMGRSLLNDPKVGLSRREFVEEYEGKADAAQVLLDRDVEMFFETYEKPALMTKMLNQRMATDITYNPESMQFIGADGAEKSPSEVMATKTGVGAGTTPASSEGGMRNPGMPAMSDLKSPGTVQVEGLR